MHKKWRRMLVKQQIDLKNEQQSLPEKIEEEDNKHTTLRRRKKSNNKAID